MFPGAGRNIQEINVAESGSPLGNVHREIIGRLKKCSETFFEGKREFATQVFKGFKWT